MNYSIYDHIINIFINKIIKFHLKKKTIEFYKCVDTQE